MICGAAVCWVGLGSAGMAAPEQAVITLPVSKIPVAVDGSITPEEYSDAVILGDGFVGWGVSPRPQSPTVYLKRDGERLYVLYDNPLKDGERPSMTGAVADNSGICLANAVELFFMPHLPSGELLEYIQFIGNARNCIYDGITRPQVGVTYVAEFTKPWLFANQIVPGHWYSEISTKFSDINVRDTKNGEYFDFDFGRDGGCGPGKVHSYTMAYHEIQNGKAVRVIFDDTAPVVQWLSFGDFENNTFNPKLRLKSSGKADTYTVSFVLTDPETLKELFSKSIPVQLGKDGSQDVTVSFPLEPKSKGVARYRITDSTGQVVFFRELPYTANLTALPLYPTNLKSKPLVAGAFMAPSYGRFGVTADIIDYPGDKSKVAIEVSAFRDGSKDPLGTVRLDKFPLDFASGILEAGTITEGTYQVKFRAIDRESGKPLGYEDEVTLTRKPYEWENNTLGISDKVPEPWTPLRVEDGAVRVWGRDYRFTGLGLPKSILTLQPGAARGEKIRDVLASPVRLVAEAAGKKLAWQEGKSEIVSAKDTEAVVQGNATTAGLKAEVKGTLDYDGFYKIHLRITPTDAQASYDSIRVEVPLPDEIARLFHSVGESMRTNKTFADFAGLKDGVLWDSKTAARNSLVKGNFLPVAWLGDEDRGIAWMCDNDRTWQITFDKPALDVVRKDGVTAFRMHLLNKPGTLREPIDVTFSLQATPVRPRPVGGTWKTVEWYGWGHFDMALIYDKCFDAYAQGKLPENGPWYRTPKAKEENHWWRYGCFASDRINPLDPIYGQMNKDFGGEWYSDNVFGKYQNRAHQDFELWAWKQWHDKASMDGVYFDNTFPAPSLNLLNNTAWVDEEGRLRPGYGVMGARDFMKRFRQMLLEFGPSPVLKSHITDTPIPGYLGFCDFWMDGENGGYPDNAIKNPDFVDRWYNPVGMANLRITLGPQWGPIPQYLYSFGADATHTVLGMFDLENDYRPMGRTPYHNFGSSEEGKDKQPPNYPFVFADSGTRDADVEFIPYWAAKPVAKVVEGGPDVLVTAWKRPGQARLLISNLSPDERTIAVEVDLAALGLPADSVVLDEREGSQLPSKNGRISNLKIPRHNYTTLIVAKPGLHTPLASDLGQALRPAADKRIKDLSDDFTTLRADWEKKTSPHFDTITSGSGQSHGVQAVPFVSAAGVLRVRTSSGLVARLQRPFGQDNVSVQVKLREPFGQYQGGFSPGLHLDWKDGRSISITGWNIPGDNLVCSGEANGASVFQVPGPKMERFTWVKIALQPDTIEFFASTDGQSWTLIHAQPREGFEGAPDILALGHGSETDGAPEPYMFDSFFSELITAGLPADK